MERLSWCHHRRQQTISNSRWHAILLLFRESEKLARIYPRRAPFLQPRPFSPPFSTHLSSPSPPHGFKAFLNPPSFSLHPVQPPLCQAGFLINPSTPLINDRCPSPFYDQRFRSPLIDADHHGFLTPFLTPPLLNGDRVSRADRCASGDDTF